MEYTLIIEKDEEGWFVGSIAELPGCHTQARSLPQLLERMKEAIEVYREGETDIPSIQFIGIQTIEA